MVLPLLRDIPSLRERVLEQHRLSSPCPWLLGSCRSWWGILEG